jgi:hypothetical protein
VGLVESVPVQVFADVQESLLVGRLRQRQDMDVVGDVEVGGVDPHWPSRAQRRIVQDLAQPGDQVQPSGDRLTHLPDAQPACRVDDRGGVQHGDHADVLRPAEPVRPQHAQVLPGQPFHRRQSLRRDRPSVGGGGRGAGRSHGGHLLADASLLRFDTCEERRTGRTARGAGATVHNMAAAKTDARG